MTRTRVLVQKGALSMSGNFSTDRHTPTEIDFEIYDICRSTQIQNAQGNSISVNAIPMLLVKNVVDRTGRSFGPDAMLSIFPEDGVNHALNHGGLHRAV